MALDEMRRSEGLWRAGQTFASMMTGREIDEEACRRVQRENRGGGVTARAGHRLDSGSALGSARSARDHDGAASASAVPAAAKRRVAKAE